MNDVSTHHNGGAKGTRTPDLFVAKVAPGRELGRQDGNGARGRADGAKSASPATAAGRSSPLRKNLDQNVSVAALDELGRDGLPPEAFRSSASSPGALPG